LVTDPVVRKTYLGDSFRMEDFSRAREGDRKKAGPVRRLTSFVFGKSDSAEKTPQAGAPTPNPAPPPPAPAQPAPPDQGPKS
jgi:hypothetical protein